MKAPLSAEFKKLLNDPVANARFVTWIVANDSRSYSDIMSGKRPVVDGIKTVFNEATDESYIEIQGTNEKPYRVLVDKTYPADEIVNIPAPQKKSWVQKLLNI